MDRISTLCISVAAALAAVVHGPAFGRELRQGGKLVLTNGISTIEGASGGGLTPWAVIAGNETKDGIGAQGAVTFARLSDFDFRDVNIAIGVHDRVEVSYARQSFDTRKVGGTLGLGNGYTFDQDIYGLKVKLAGDAVYGPELMPAVAVGVEYKKSLNSTIVRAVGARSDDGLDAYISATKLFLRHSVLANATLRATKANQQGLLGFGGDRSNSYSLKFEGSLAYQASRRFLIGGEYRSKPDNLGFAREDNWFDMFAAYAVGHHLTVTAAYTDLGSIAKVDRQRGVLLQLQGSF